jgi:hypothetical protein
MQTAPLTTAPLATAPPDLAVPPPDHSVQHGGCMQRSVSICLRSHGLEPPVLLGRSLRFMREWGPPFRHKSLVMDGAFFLFASYFDDARDALRRHGITLTYCQGMGRDLAWEWLAERVRAGRPVAALLDSFHLPCYPNFFQKLHLTHVYVVGKIDQAEGLVYLLNPRTEIEVWPIPLEVFLTAWAREEYEWYDIAVPDSLAPYTTDDLREDLRENVRGMLPDHPGEQWANGVGALRRFAGELATYPDQFGEEELKGILEDGFHQLPNVREQRWLHGMALRLIGLEIECSELHELGRRLDDLGRGWSVARNAFVRAADASDPARGVQRLVGRLHELADGEERLMADVAAFVASPRWPAGVDVGRELRAVPEPV